MSEEPVLNTDAARMNRSDIGLNPRNFNEGDDD